MSLRALLFAVVASTTSLSVGSPPASPSALQVWRWREEAREMMTHAFSSYMTFGFPGDEVRPLTCLPRTWDARSRGTLDDVHGGYFLTLVDSLDTLALTGDLPAFRCAVSRVVAGLSLDRDVQVSVFEASIRVVGGLLSAHLLSVDADLGIWSAGDAGSPPSCRRPGAARGMSCDDSDPSAPTCLASYDGQLLSIAAELGRRLLPAFATPSGLPFHRVNLRTGVADPESRATCTAAAGTFLVEFGLLSRLTGDPTFEAVARAANDALWTRRSALGLIGNAIDAIDGGWRSVHSGVGGGTDSWLEYLVKAGIALDDDALIERAEVARQAVADHLDFGDIHVEVASSVGRLAPRAPTVLSALQAFYPATEVLAGDVESARKHLVPLVALWAKYKALPELFALEAGMPPPGLGYGADSPLRPELSESAYAVFLSTRDASLLAFAGAQLAALNNVSRTPCGYAAIADVSTGRLDDRMDSYFIAETAKYLFLTLDSALWRWGASGNASTNTVAEVDVGAGGDAREGAAASPNPTLLLSPSFLPSTCGAGSSIALEHLRAGAMMNATTEGAVEDAAAVGGRSGGGGTSFRSRLHARARALYPRAHPLAFVRYDAVCGMNCGTADEHGGFVASLPLDESRLLFTTEGHALILSHWPPVATSPRRRRRGASTASAGVSAKSSPPPSPSESSRTKEHRGVAMPMELHSQCPWLTPAHHAAAPSAPLHASAFSDAWAKVLSTPSERVTAGDPVAPTPHVARQCTTANVNSALAAGGLLAPAPPLPPPNASAAPIGEERAGGREGVGRDAVARAWATEAYAFPSSIDLHPSTLTQDLWDMSTAPVVLRALAAARAEGEAVSRAAATVAAGAGGDATEGTRSASIFDLLRRLGGAFSGGASSHQPPQTALGGGAAPSLVGPLTLRVERVRGGGAAWASGAWTSSSTASSADGALGSGPFFPAELLSDALTRVGGLALPLLIEHVDVTCDASRGICSVSAENSRQSVAVRVRVSTPHPPPDGQNLTFVGAGASFGPLFSAFGERDVAPVLARPFNGCGATGDQASSSPYSSGNVVGDGRAPFLAVTSRGECSFVQKARAAQLAGASALLVLDLPADILTAGGGTGGVGDAPDLVAADAQLNVVDGFTLFPFLLADDGTSMGGSMGAGGGAAITIPSVLLERPAAVSLWRWLSPLCSVEGAAGVAGVRFSIGSVAATRGGDAGTVVAEGATSSPSTIPSINTLLIHILRAIFSARKIAADGKTSFAPLAINESFSTLFYDEST